MLSSGDTHLAYPFTVRNSGSLWCIPDASFTGVVRAHRVSAPHDAWDDGFVLLHDVPAADPTVIEYDGRWWLFCTRHDDAPSVNLHVFHAPTLRGPWSPHSANPVKSDVRSSRPAGTPFIVAGVLHRPAQDCSRAYGGAVTINRVMGLTPTRFVEEVAAVVPPDPSYPDGLHTLSAFGDRTLVDGRRRVWAPMKPFRRLVGRATDIASRASRHG